MKEKPFPEIWNGGRARAIREQLAGDLPPVCQRCCVTHESEAPLLKRVAAKLRTHA